jgi:hypothetical protein
MGKSILIWISFWLSATFTLSAAEVNIRFYSEDCSLQYDLDILPRQRLRVTGSSIAQFYSFLEKSNYQGLLQNLAEQKIKLKLNDWLFYQLLIQASDKIYAQRSANEKSLLTWFLLNKSGLDTRITFRDQQIYLCAFTDEKIFEVPLIKQEQKTFVNLSEINRPTLGQEPVYLLDFVANPEGRPFSFSLKEMPAFKQEIEQKYIKFHFRDSLYNWPVQVNRTYIKLMERYPFVNEVEYIEAPMSALLLNSLLPQIKQSIQGMDQERSVQFLVAFTRNAFRYMEDKSYFGRSKPMIPDEVLHYPFSDCEDRSALFYALVREVLAIPMVLIAYPDHLTVAVHLPESTGESIYYQGKNYLFCDPTGPANSIEIGRIPSELKGIPYEIIHHFRKN